MATKKADRARQFLPFDALKGYKEALKEKQKVIIPKKQLSEDDEQILSFKLNQIKKGIMKRKMKLLKVWFQSLILIKKY